MGRFAPYIYSINMEDEHMGIGIKKRVKGYIYGTALWIIFSAVILTLAGYDALQLLFTGQGLAISLSAGIGSIISIYVIERFYYTR
jgi:preprotein translocase subunit SecD